MMNALQVHSRMGGAASHQILPIPTPAKDEIRVKVKFAALDTRAKAVLAKDFNGVFIMPWHYDGTVDAVGADVTTRKIGDDVFGSVEPKETK